VLKPRSAPFRHGVAVVLLSVVAACAEPPSQPAPTQAPSSGPSTTVTPDDSGTAAGSTTPPPASVATIAPRDLEAAVSPLTGLTVTGLADRPALVVKIDNHDRARPQFGLNAADVVYEQIVEGGLTRFAAVFHSRSATPVGPVRSVRTSDFPLLSNLGRPLFANSGGNENVLSLLADVDVVDVSSNSAGQAYYRFDGRFAPHNLLTGTDDLWAAGAERGATGRPPQLFEFGDTTEAADAITTVGVTIEYGTTVVTYVWDADVAGWAREQDGTPHVDADGGPVAPTNLVVQFVSYGRSAADGRSPEAELVGSGEAWIFAQGRRVVAQWERATERDVTTFVDEAGDPVPLTPGTTWVALARVGQVSVNG